MRTCGWSPALDVVAVLNRVDINAILHHGVVVGPHDGRDLSLPTALQSVGGHGADAAGAHDEDPSPSLRHGCL